ncbi:MAG TPA: type II toxin-antitoxin system VapB family antitoxin [Caulobacteraceae bacterium]|nr:type II toxin-antitoxin system VapB family antitoxin [Caulobacteraceae bacterium]
MTAVAKIFMHGRSQAVRLPKECRFEGSEVRVTKVGDQVILEPIKDQKAVPWELIDSLVDGSFMPNGREQPAMPKDDIDFDS